jgi:hypothetical protein
MYLSLDIDGLQRMMSEVVEVGLFMARILSGVDSLVRVLQSLTLVVLD